MSPDPVDGPAGRRRRRRRVARNAPLTRPRPGSRRPRRHAEVRLRRRPARPRAGQRAGDRGPGRARRRSPRAFLEQAAGVGGAQHVVSLGAAAGARRAALPAPDDVDARSTPTRCAALDADGVGRDGRRGRRAPQGRRHPRRRRRGRSPTGCRRGSGSTCTGTAGSTRGWPARSWASRRSRASRSATASAPPARRGSQAHDEIERDAPDGIAPPHRPRRAAPRAA